MKDDKQNDRQGVALSDDFETAFNLIFEAYGAPGDRFRDDTQWLYFVRKRVTEAFGLLQKVRASSSRAEVEREAGLGAVLMDACRSLPSGCGVVINAENGWAGVTFCDADGNEFDMDDGETSITGQVRNALAAAEAPNGGQS